MQKQIIILISTILLFFISGCNLVEQNQKSEKEAQLENVNPESSKSVYEERWIIIEVIPTNIQDGFFIIRGYKIIEQKFKVFNCAGCGKIPTDLMRAYYKDRDGNFIKWDNGRTV